MSGKTWHIFEHDEITGERCCMVTLSYNPVDKIMEQQNVIDNLLGKIRRVTEAITEEVDVELE